MARATVVKDSGESSRTRTGRSIWFDSDLEYLCTVEKGTYAFDPMFVAKSVSREGVREFGTQAYAHREMPHLLRLSLKHGPPDDHAPFPFSVPQVHTLPLLNVDVPVTFFVGENGSGKSTLLEGIAAAAELPAMGGIRGVEFDPTLEHAVRLGAALRLAWTRRSRQGFFLRAEDFFGRIKALARDDARAWREKLEALRGVRADAPRVVTSHASHPDEHDVGTFLGRYDGRSHGESFMDVFTERIKPGGLYLLDEPEAPLSPRRQIALLDVLARTSRAGAQFIIATHSPILLACPGARIHSFDQCPIAHVAYEDLDHVSVTRDFLNDPGRFIAR
jgi:predicted ATPase